MNQRFHCTKAAYEERIDIMMLRASFYGLLAALKTKADLENALRIESAWPEFVEHSYHTVEGEFVLESKPSFYGLLAALVYKADNDNRERIRRTWPGFAETFFQRYNAPGGILEEDK